MKQASKFIGLIPAREGSKGLLNKNTLKLLDKPLVQYTIEAAMDSSLIDDVWVSSDDPEVLRIAKSAQANQLIRPKEFALDKSSAIDVVSHFLSTLPLDDKTVNNYIVYLQPTSPMRNCHHIDDAINHLLLKKAHSLVSLIMLRKSPFKSFLIDETGRLQSLFNEELSNARRQDLQDVYIPNGAIYIFQIKEFIKRNSFPSNGSIPFIMNAEDSIDIDEKEDLIKAEKILRTKNA
jgi:CMP-N,N'-diacetyllegionaminic acid synthase